MPEDVDNVQEDNTQMKIISKRTKERMKKAKKKLVNEAFYYDPTISYDDDSRVSIGLLNVDVNTVKH